MSRSETLTLPRVERARAWVFQWHNEILHGAFGVVAILVVFAVNDPRDRFGYILGVALMALLILTTPDHD
jgi:hypothetical protein